MRWTLPQVWLCRFCLLLANVSCGKGEVRRLSPTSGSLCGGTRLSIYGSGFAEEASENRVEIGDAECKVETVSKKELVCQVPFRNQQVVTGKESVTELVSIHVKGKPLSMAKPFEYTYKAESAPIIIDWGPGKGQANDVLSFQGKDVLFGASVTLGGRECKVKHSEGIYLQCVPPPREAGVSTIEVNFGPDRGFACPGSKAPPLKFTYNLALQSALPAELGDDTKGPLDGGGQLTAGPCSPRGPSSKLVIVGQGLGNSTVFKLCGGDTWCEREGGVQEDPEIYHSGDWSFQTVTCRPGPLDPAKAPGGTRTCDLTAEAADGMFVATLADAYTYGPFTIATTTTPPAVIATIPPAPETQVYIGGPMPAPAPPQAFFPTAPPGVATVVTIAPAPSPVAPLSPAPVPAPVPVAVPAPALPMVVPVLVPTQKPRSKERKAVNRMARRVLSKAFKRMAEALGPAKAQSQSFMKDVDERKASGGLPPPVQASGQAVVQDPADLPPPPPLPLPDAEEDPPPPPLGLQASPASAPAAASAEVLLQEVEASLRAAAPVLRGGRRQ